MRYKGGTIIGKLEPDAQVGDVMVRYIGTANGMLTYHVVDEANDVDLGVIEKESGRSGRYVAKGQVGLAEATEFYGWYDTLTEALQAVIDKSVILDDFEVLVVSGYDSKERRVIDLEEHDFDEGFALEEIWDWMRDVLAHIVFDEDADEDDWSIEDVGPMLGHANFDLDVLCYIGRVASEDIDIWAAVLDHYGDHYAHSAIDCLKDGEIIIWGSWDEIISQWAEIYEIPEKAQYYIDDKSLRHDLEIDGSYTTLDDGRVLEFIG